MSVNESSNFENFSGRFSLDGNRDVRKLVDNRGSCLD